MDSLTNHTDWIVVDINAFQNIPGFPFAYWLPLEILNLFKTLAPFEPTFGVVSQGLGTTDDFRFCRLRFEVTPATLGLYIPDKQALIDSTSRWIPYVKGDRFSPYFDDFPLVVNWAADGKEVKEYNRERYGSASRNVKSEGSYGIPGLVFPRRTKRFAPRYYPAGMIFSVGGQSMLPIQNPLSVLGYGCTSLANALVGSMLGRVDMDPQYEVGVIKRLPFPQIDGDMTREIEILVRGAIRTIALSLELDECSSFFSALFVGKAVSSIDQLTENTRQHLSLLRDVLIRTHDRVEYITAELLNLSQEIIKYLQVGFVSIRADIFELDLLESANRIVSFCLGACFGRWNIRNTEFRITHSSDPTDSPLTCPPGMLQNIGGLPATPADVPADYPLRISWPGILVDDDTNTEDIVGRVHDALAVIWPDTHEAIEQEACQILGVAKLRDYFASPNRFFDDHLKRYSKSRRQAPIYWPLSTPSGSYTLWLYYHRLTDQTLYSCVNDFVEPKLAECGRQMADLRRLGQRSAAQEQEAGDAGQSGARVGGIPRRVAAPGANLETESQRRGADHRGAVVAALPASRLAEAAARDVGEVGGRRVRLGAPGLYALAGRVREKCKTDKSLAIAHGLEELYVEPPVGGRRGRDGRRLLRRSRMSCLSRGLRFAPDKT